MLNAKGEMYEEYVNDITNNVIIAVANGQLIGNVLTFQQVIKLRITFLCIIVFIRMSTTKMLSNDCAHGCDSNLENTGSCTITLVHLCLKCDRVLFSLLLPILQGHQMLFTCSG